MTSKLTLLERHLLDRPNRLDAITAPFPANFGLFTRRGVATLTIP